jgi:23S rRNA (uracil747-C5)-methyltransferase
MDKKLSSYCPYYPKICQSCGLIDLSFEEYLTKKKKNHDQLILPSSSFSGRNKAKLVVSGSIDHPILGLADREILACPLHMQSINELTPKLLPIISKIKLAPYDLATQKGELKYIIIFANEKNEFILRFVLRSKEAISRIQKHLKEILDLSPNLRIVTANIQPEHTSIIEGDEEIYFTDQKEILVKLNQYQFIVGPQTFFQTNLEIAEKLFSTVESWVKEIKPSEVLDLFCGIGTFATFMAKSSQRVIGVELNAKSIEYANKSKTINQLTNVDFIAKDTKEFLKQNQSQFDLILVNPPRRGLMKEDLYFIEKLKPKKLIYSSCNPETYERDRLQLSQYKEIKQIAFDMFPLTEHLELLTLLELID